VVFERRGPLPSFSDVLITQVNYGELTPQQAELEVGLSGLEPFEFRPDPPDFDPMKETTWSLVMALAWIMWRTPDAVREMWNRYRQEFRFWVPRSWQVPGGPIHKGHFLEKKDPAALMDLTLLAAEIPLNRHGVNEQQAFRLLSIEAERGALTATGRPSNDLRERRTILPFEWIDFRLGQRDRDFQSKPEPFLAIRMRGEWCIGYDDVRIWVADLVRSFPDVDAERLSTASNQNTSVPLDDSHPAHKRPVATKRSGRGRKKGTGSFENPDAPLVDEMLGLIKSGQVVSIAAAALQFAPKAFGTARVESKRDRLAKRFREKYGSDIARIKSD
jgi:hypothetical protein